MMAGMSAHVRDPIKRDVGSKAALQFRRAHVEPRDKDERQT